MSVSSEHARQILAGQPPARHLSCQMLLRHSPLCCCCCCSAALCYPKVTGGKVQKAMKKCPDGFTLEKDGSGKAMCVQQSSSNWLAAASFTAAAEATVDRPLTQSAQPKLSTAQTVA